MESLRNGLHETISDVGASGRNHIIFVDKDDDETDENNASSRIAHALKEKHIKLAADKMSKSLKKVSKKSKAKLAAKGFDTVPEVVNLSFRYLYFLTCFTGQQWINLKILILFQKTLLLKFF